MSATNAFEDGLLALTFKNANLANVGDVTGLRGSTTAGVFYISIHTASPGETGDQSTSQAAYTNYARQVVNRDAGSWDATSGMMSNHNAITFPQSGSGPEVEVAIGIGSALTGVGNLFIFGSLASNLTVNNLITPTIAAGDLDITLD